MEMKKYKLSEICELNNATLKSSDNIDEILYLDTSNITENCIDELQPFYTKDAPSRAQRKVKDKSIIFSTVRPNQKHFGILNNPPKNLIVSTGFTTLDVKKTDEFDANYVYLKLTQPYIVNHLQTLAQNSVSSYPSINPDDIGNLRFDFPPLPTQQKIADVLSTLDNKIALNHRINAKLEAMAKRLYDYWFVQFDYPDKNGKPYKTSGGKMVWNEVLKREIPEGWEVKRLGEVCDFRNGINYEKNNSGDKIYKIVNVRNITATTFFLNQNDFDEICLQSKIADNYLIPEISILIARSGSPGATRVIMNVKNNVIFCGFIICMEKFTPKYKFYFTYFLKKLENTNATKTGGSILQNVSQDTLKRLSVIIPPKEMIDEFNEKILPIFNYQLTIQKEIQKLTNLRDRLLPLLMNGQVEVGTNNSSEFCNEKLGKQATACDMNGQVEVEG